MSKNLTITEIRIRNIQEAWADGMMTVLDVRTELYMALIEAPEEDDTRDGDNPTRAVKWALALRNEFASI
jgi:hypothetical protein